MTTISQRKTWLSDVRKVSPTTLLAEAVGVTNFVILTNGEQTITRTSDIKPTQHTGTKPWIVVTESEMAEELKKINNRLADLEADVTILGAPYIRNAAAETLQFAIGGQPKDVSPSTPFRNLFRNHPTLIPKVIIDAWNTQYNVESMCDLFDQVVQRRNCDTHKLDSSSSVVDNREHLLKNVVGPAVGILNRRTTLQEECKQEYFILSNAENIVDSLRAALSL